MKVPQTNQDIDILVATTPGTSDPEFAAKVRASIERAVAEAATEQQTFVVRMVCEKCK